MNYYLAKYNEVPPGGYRYKDSDTGVWVKADCWQNLLAEARKHRKANDLPIPSDMDQRVENQLCSILPAEWCRGRPQGALGAPRPLTLSEAIAGTKALIERSVRGEEVPLAEVEARARICVQVCPYNQTYMGCNSCSKRAWRDSFAKAVSEPQPFDERLMVCTICGCGLSAKVRTPLDILQKYLTPQQQEALPPHCWCKKK